MSRARLPITTIAVFAITAIATTLQYFFPLLPRFERQPGALAAHEYWRLITPIFFHREGWRQIVFDFCASRSSARSWNASSADAAGCCLLCCGHHWRNCGPGMEAAGRWILGRNLRIAGRARRMAAAESPAHAIALRRNRDPRGSRDSHRPARSAWTAAIGRNRDRMGDAKARRSEVECCRDLISHSRNKQSKLFERCSR